MINLYIDQDGISADWSGYMLRNHFPKLSSIDELNKHPSRDYLLRKVYRKDPHLFNRLQINPQFRRVLKGIEKLKRTYPINVKKLTATGEVHHNAKMVRRDKKEWLQRKFNIDPENVIVMNRPKDKVKYANVNSILIDDFDDTVVSWVKTGGHGILVDANTYCPKIVLNRIEAKCKFIIDHQ